MYKNKKLIYVPNNNIITKFDLLICLICFKFYFYWNTPSVKYIGRYTKQVGRYIKLMN